MVSKGVDIKAYMPMKLLESREANIKVVAVSLEATNAILTSPLCANSMLPLEATLTIFKATLDSNSVVLKDKEQVAKAGNYLAKWLVTIAVLVDKSMHAMAALYDTIPCGKGGR